MFTHNQDKPMKRTEKQSRSISRSSAKDKGRRLQKWICEQISELTGFEWGSSGEDKPIESRPMGQSGPDIRMESQVREAFPFSIEAKWQERWNVPGYIRQAQENQMEGTDWLLVMKRNYEDPVIIMDAKRFFNLYEELRN